MRPLVDPKNPSRFAPSALKAAANIVAASGVCSGAKKKELSEEKEEHEKNTKHRNTVVDNITEKTNELQDTQQMPKNASNKEETKHAKCCPVQNVQQQTHAQTTSVIDFQT